MATAQMTRNTVSLVAIPNRIATEQQSLALIKKLLAVSVSCITYLRGLFPEYAYGTRYLEDICVKILREDKSCPGSTQLVQWMLGCYDALQKKYLRMVVLAIYTNPEDPQTITECYQFKFKYTSSGPVMDFTSGKGESSVSACSDIKKASVLLIRKLYILMQNLGHLPNDVFLTMNLFYYDEVTPPEYQPPGFKEASCDGMMFEGEPMHLNVGGVTTPYHVLKVKVTTEKDRMEIAEEALLRKEEDGPPSHVMQMDSEETEKTDHAVTGETASLNGEKQNVESMDTQEVNLDYEGAENAESDQNEEPQIKRQNPRSESTGLKTRSGKIFSSQFEEASSKTVQPASAKSKTVHQATKQRRPFEIPMSQEESSTPKRRKYSEPKDLY